MAQSFGQVSPWGFARPAGLVVPFEGRSGGKGRPLEGEEISGRGDVQAVKTWPFELNLTHNSGGKFIIRVLLSPFRLKLPRFAWVGRRGGGKAGKNIWNSPPERTEGSGGGLYKHFSRSFPLSCRNYTEFCGSSLAKTAGYIYSDVSDYNINFYFHIALQV
jgi:hypothetical protein